MRIRMLLHKSVEHDGRVQREARALVEVGHEVTVVHLPQVSAVSVSAGERFSVVSASLPRLRKLLPFGAHRPLEALNMLRHAVAGKPDVVHAHDAAMLAPGFIASKLRRTRLVYDSHELATGVPYHSRAWYWLVASIERVVVPRCDVVITVSEGIAARLQQRYRLEQRPTVIRNLPDLPLDGPAPDLREKLEIGDAPLVLHQGAVAAGRGGENLIRVIATVENAHLLFLGAEGAYAEGLRRHAARLEVDDRVHFHGPVPLDSLLSYTAQADVGISLLEDTCENHRHALPNKVFEYAAAGIPTIASRLPALEQLITDEGLGRVVDPADPAELGEALRAVLSAGSREERVSGPEASLTWSKERRRLCALFAELQPQSRGLGESRSRSRIPSA